MVSKITQEPTKGKSLTTYNNLEHRQKQGLLGRIFGDSGTTVFYLAFYSISLSVICFVALVISNKVQTELIAFPTSLLTLAGGLLGGRGLK